MEQPTKPTTTRRPISEAQRANLKKGMEALRARREALRAEQEHEATVSVEESPKPRVNRVREAPPPSATPAPVPPTREKRQYNKKTVSFDDFNNFKNELLSSLKPPTATTVVEKEKPVYTEKVIEKVIEKPTIKYLSGSELLDSLFFNK